jgi:hypothetical protein
VGWGGGPWVLFWLSSGSDQYSTEAMTGILFFFASVFTLCFAFLLLLLLLLPFTLVLAPIFLPSFDSTSDSESAVLVVTRSLCMTHVRRRLEKIGRVAKICTVGKVPERKSARPRVKDVIASERWRTVYRGQFSASRPDADNGRTRGTVGLMLLS